MLYCQSTAGRSMRSCCLEAACAIKWCPGNKRERMIRLRSAEGRRLTGVGTAGRGLCGVEIIILSITLTAEAIAEFRGCGCIFSTKAWRSAVPSIDYVFLTSSE